MAELLIVLASLLTWPLLLAVLLILYPEKIEKWSALLLRAFSGSTILFRSAHKKYVKHDLQGRVNDFLKRKAVQMPSLAGSRLRLEWVEPETERSCFLNGDEVVIRLRRDDPHHRNFMHAAYLYVRTGLLSKAKRYVSPSQREAIDLFVCTRLFESEKESVLGEFLDEYVHPRMDTESKLSVYVDDYVTLDNDGTFFPMFLQELEYLGEKVFGRRRDDRIISEVDGVIEFLKRIATRTVGVDGDLDYEGEYCRFALVIVGKPSKLIQSIEPYIAFIRKGLVTREFETIYILARTENREAVDAICANFVEQYRCARRYEFEKYLKYSDRKELSHQYLVVLRKRKVRTIQSSVA